MSGAAAEAPVWRRSDRVLVRRTPRSVLLATRPGTAPCRLEGAAIAVWDALDAPGTDAAILATVAARYDVEAATVRAEVVATRAALAEVGAIVGSDG